MDNRNAEAEGNAGRMGQSTGKDGSIKETKAVAQRGRENRFTVDEDSKYASELLTTKQQSSPRHACGYEFQYNTYCIYLKYCADCNPFKK